MRTKQWRWYQARYFLVLLLAADVDDAVVEVAYLQGNVCFSNGHFNNMLNAKP